MKINFSNLLLFIILLSSIYSLRIEKISNLYKWVRDNNIQFHENLRLNQPLSGYYLPYFSLNDDLPIGTVILSIPQKLFININNTYHYLKSKKFKKLYTDLMSVTNPVLKYNTTKEMVYISLGIYHSMSKDQKDNKFYKLFNSYFSFYEDFSIDYFPINYTPEEELLIRGTNFGIKMKNAKSALETEMQVMKNELDYEILNQEDFLRYRLITLANAITINNNMTVVPLLEFFMQGDNSSSSHVEWIYNNSTNSIDMKIINKYKKDEPLKIKSAVLPNSALLLFYGYTIENNNLMDTFYVDFVCPSLKEKLGIKSKTFNLTKQNFDLSDAEFVNNTINTYYYLSKQIKKYDTVEPYGPMLLMKHNLEHILKFYDRFDFNAFNNVFTSIKKVNDVYRVISDEIEFLQNRISMIDDLLKNHKIKYDEL